MLGNLSIKEIEERVGVTFPEETKTLMQKTHETNATVPEGKWHCFDMPFIIVCGGRELAEQIVEGLMPLTKDFKTQLQVGIR